MSSEYLTEDELTRAEDMPQADVILARGKVRVRGMSRGEALAMQALKDQGIIKDEAMWEQHMIHTAMVQPKVSRAKVQEWQEGRIAGEMGPVIRKIEELSGMREGAQKSDVPEVREGTGG